MRLNGLLAAVVPLALVAVGCGFLVRPAAPPDSSCAGMLSGACTEQVARLAAQVTGKVTSIGLECRIAVCDRSAGSGDAVITYADGRTERRTWSYVGDPAPIPAPTCVGLARDVCQTQADGVVEDAAPSRRIIGISITCQGTCTKASGEVATVLTFGDGTQDTSGRGWSSGGS